MSKEKDFVKIPASIINEPWGKNPNAVYLYTWLCIHADKRGKIVTSLRQIAKLTKLSLQQVRTAFQKLVSTQVVTQVVTQGSTQVATEITVSHLASCKGEKKSANTSINTSCNTSCNTSKEEIPPYPPNKENTPIPLKENIPPISPKEEAPQKRACEKFHDWLSQECPYICKHYKLTTEAEYDKLVNQYGERNVMEQCSNIENRADLRKRYTNLYRTLLNWLKNEAVRNNQQYHADGDHPNNKQVVHNTYEIIDELREREKQGFDSSVRPF